jgi:hypothetical protein
MLVSFPAQQYFRKALVTLEEVEHETVAIIAFFPLVMKQKFGTLILVAMQTLDPHGQENCSV